MEKLVRLSDTEMRTLSIPADEVWRNDVYRVAVVRNAGKFDGRNVVRLSIKRHDDASVHSWGDFQAIKNQLVGENYTGVELYPAESDLTDQANRYHLWVIADPTYRFPFSWTGRATKEENQTGELVEE